VRPLFHCAARVAAFGVLCTSLLPARSASGDTLDGAVAHELELRLASPVVPGWMAADGRNAAHWAALQRFYKERRFAPAWQDEGTPRPAAHALASALTRLGADGLDPERYAPAAVAEPAAFADGQPQWPTALADRDLRLSYTFLRVAHDVLEGRVSPRGASPYWAAAPAAEIDGPRVLSEASGGPGPEAVLRGLSPAHRQFQALTAALERHRALAAAGGWPRLPDLPVLRRGGRRHPGVALLRRRLLASNDLAATGAPADPALFDRTLEQALKGFQARHGLAVHGRLDAATRAALDVPVEDRIARIELNLERWRWLPRELGERYVLVNVPAFELHAVDRDRVAERMKIVSGRAGESPTPVFSSGMTTVVFSPWWNVPPGIAAGEIVPAMAKSRGYLRRRGLQMVGGGEDDDPQFRQPPGPRNPMGAVKFQFPNPFHVYLHDTPNDALFARPRRDLSHGCMRVERPLALARWVLDDPRTWSDGRLQAAMNARVERMVALPETIPVHVVYFTVWVENDGTPRFLPDVYGHDEPQMELLRRGTPWQRVADRVAGLTP
jgi:L,D-transpeptidase YcbB